MQTPPHSAWVGALGCLTTASGALFKTIKRKEMIMTCSIDNLTLGQIKELKSFFGNNTPTPTTEHPFEIGKLYFIRTVTMHLLGKLEWVGQQELRLSQASWVADSGRFHDALKTGKLNEVEPFIMPIIVGRGSIVDATEWSFDLPKEQK